MYRKVVNDGNPQLIQNRYYKEICEFLSIKRIEPTVLETIEDTGNIINLTFNKVVKMPLPLTNDTVSTKKVGLYENMGLGAIWVYGSPKIHLLNNDVITVLHAELLDKGPTIIFHNNGVYKTIALDLSLGDPIINLKNGHTLKWTHPVIDFDRGGTTVYQVYHGGWSISFNHGLIIENYYTTIHNESE
jgi:hypothetical protein